jgi:hypothetical protein
MTPFGLDSMFLSGEVEFLEFPFAPSGTQAAASLEGQERDPP